MHDLADRADSPAQRRLMESVRERFGNHDYAVTKLLGDASTRQYFRLSFPRGDSLILAAYPDPFEPDDFPYRNAYDLLSGIGLRLPRIIEMDGPRGIVFQQDLGDVTLQRRLLTCSPKESRRYFEESVDCIVKMQLDGTSAVSPDSYPARMAFDRERFVWELAFFDRYYRLDYRGLAKRSDLEREFEALADELDRRPRVLCHRDLHVRNLMIYEDDLYVIDFQDARLGPETYDLVSLVKDSVHLPEERIQGLVELYRQRVGDRSSEDEFRREFDLMSVQRLLKALGTFAYQIKQRANFLYEQYMPGALNRARDSAERLGDLPATRGFLDEECSRLSSRETHPASMS